WRRRRIPPRALACFAGLVTTWVLVGLFRRPDEYGANRYVYAGTVFLVLILAEIARTYRPRPAVVAVLGAAVLAILVSDVRELRHAPRFVAPFFDGARTELRRLQCVPGLPPATPAK